jgi:hypothetical protein
MLLSKWRQLFQEVIFECDGYAVANRCGGIALCPVSDLKMVRDRRGGFWMRTRNHFPPTKKQF